MPKSTEETTARVPNPAHDPAGYLKAHGWKPDGKLWEDPQGGYGTTKVQVGTEKTDTGAEKPVYQTVCQPIPWSYTTADAVELQQSREKR